MNNILKDNIKKALLDYIPDATNIEVQRYPSIINGWAIQCSARGYDGWTYMYNNDWAAGHKVVSMQYTKDWPVVDEPITKLD